MLSASGWVKGEGGATQEPGRMITQARMNKVTITDRGV